MRTSIPGTGSLGWGGGGGWYFLQKEGRQGGSGIGPSFNYLPTHVLFGISRFHASCLFSNSFFSPTPTENNREGEARPSGAVGRSGREGTWQWQYLGTLTSSPRIQVLPETTQTKSLYESEHKIARMCFWEFWQKSAFCRSYGFFVKRQSLSLCPFFPHLHTRCQHQGNLTFPPVVPQHPNSSTFFSLKLTCLP